ncbi:MAG: hypothetical protein LBB88_02850 [Planctomycetaceae bacterium]|nr:hypothetical protein [Planctomycetaceae bacterium]
MINQTYSSTDYMNKLAMVKRLDESLNALGSIPTGRSPTSINRLDIDKFRDSRAKHFRYKRSC